MPMLSAKQTSNCESIEMRARTDQQYRPDPETSRDGHRRKPRGSGRAREAEGVELEEASEKWPQGRESGGLLIAPGFA
jgi:hypothetical protein